jgi:hypothetical protein
MPTMPVSNLDQLLSGDSTILLIRDEHFFCLFQIS